MTEKPMRVVFGETLAELGDKHSNLVVLDSDVSSSTQTKIFGTKYPERFFNFGIAEANMVSAAAGMATCNLVPVVSTFAFLLALRTGDSVRSLIAYNNLNVKIVGGYAGLSDFADGASHQSVCDIAVMNALPNMTVIVPSDIETTKWAVKAMLEYKGPVYLRLSRNPVKSLHEGRAEFEIGKAVLVKQGSDITFAVTGTLLENAIKAAEILKEQGISAEILEFATIKPFDGSALIESAQKTKRVITIEEHSTIGGLGSIAAQVLSGRCPTQLKQVGIQDRFGQSGVYDELLKEYELTGDSIAECAVSMLNDCIEQEK